MSPSVATAPTKFESVIWALQSLAQNGTFVRRTMEMRLVAHGKAEDWDTLATVNAGSYTKSGAASPTRLFPQRPSELVTDKVATEESSSTDLDAAVS